MIAGHVDKVLITTTLGSRGLEKKIVVYISPEVMMTDQKFASDFFILPKMNKIMDNPLLRTWATSWQL